MHETLVAILVLLASALVLGAAAERLRQTAVLGYLLAGTVVGPNALGLVDGADRIGALAELGASTLLFSIGTEFSLVRLRAFGRRTFAAGVLQVAGTVVVGMLAARALGLAWGAAFAVGAVVSLSSTAVVARLLVERRALDAVHGRLAMGTLLTQDILVVPLVVAVGAAGGEGGSAALGSAARTAGWAVALVVGFAVLVRWVFPWFLAGRGMSRNRELVAVFAAVCAVGSALGAESVGLSPALGAFAAGALLGSSPYAAQVRAEVAPLRTLLATLFFAAVGLAGDPSWAWQHAPQVLLVVGAIVAGKWIVAAGAARATGATLPFAVAAGLCLAQIGEFSFVIAEGARASGLFDPDLHKLLVTATIGTLLVTPGAVGLAVRIARGWHRGGPTEGNAPDAGRPILIVGFGPAGMQAYRRLHGRRGADCTVIDSNPALVSLARSMGAHAHLGDAGRTETLEHAGAAGARLVLVTMADPGTAEHVASLLRHAAPGAAIVARSRYHAVADDIHRAGAHRVVDEETLVGERLALEAEAVLRSPASA
jgi:CPA2 family monovalent cation:H+ antiporter-2